MYPVHWVLVIPCGALVVHSLTILAESVTGRNLQDSLALKHIAKVIADTLTAVEAQGH
jgi:hypothetical protein